MARPIKKGLDYFSLDVNFYNDIKIRKIVRRKGGEALSVYTVLLCNIYEKGYYLEWSDDVPFLISEATGFEEDKVKELILYCIDIGLFDKQMFDVHHIITSGSIQKRYFAICALTKRKVDLSSPFLLNDDDSENVSSDKTAVSSEEISVTSEEIRDNTENDGENTEETTINSGKSTQRKEKESKDNNSLRSSLSPPPTPPARVCEVDSGGKEQDADGPMTASEGAELLKADRDWLLQMQRKFCIKSTRLVRLLDSFVADCDCRGKQQHESLSDVMQHFNDWLSKQKPKKASDKGADKDDDRSLTPQQRWVMCQAELCQAVSADVSRRSFDVIRFERFDEKSSELFINVPSRETYEYMEQNLVDTMSRILPKYFGSAVQLQYHLS